MRGLLGQPHRHLLVYYFGGFYLDGLILELLGDEGGCLERLCLGGVRVQTLRAAIVQRCLAF